jgi:hypothetical protein
MSLNFALTATIPRLMVMREEFRVAKMAVKFEKRRLALQNV